MNLKSINLNILVWMKEIVARIRLKATILRANVSNKNKKINNK